jgi:murein hydrolase activator
MFFMRNVFIIILAISLVEPCFAQNSQQSTSSLRKKIQAEMKRAKEIQKKKLQLEKSIQNSQSNLKKFDKILRNYQYNLDQAQKVIDAAQTEITHIEKRNDQRELFFSYCLEIRSNYQPYYPSHGPAHKITSQSISQAIDKITQKIFQEMQAEKPRMTELLNVIEDKQALQERIFTRYLPADMEKKETHERVVTENSKAVEKAQITSAEIEKRVDKLRDELASAEKIIRERIVKQRRLAEPKRLAKAEKQRAEEEKRKKEQKTKPPQTQIAAKIPITKSQTVNGDNRPIAQQKGKLPWPAGGTIVRPFGEFTHPQYKVKMRSYGINVRVSENSPIRTVAKGIVFHTGEIAGMGSTIIIDHGDDYVTVYGNVKPQVSSQQNVTSGQVIGHTVGMEYYFGLRHNDQALNPTSWLLR